MWPAFTYIIFYLVYHLGFEVTIAKAALSPTETPSCKDKCFREMMSRYNSSVYHSCMYACKGDWPLVERGDCSKILSASVQPDAPAVCNAENIAMSEYVTIDKTNNEKYAHLQLTWSPCAAGIVDLKGFRISFITPGSFEPECHNLTLRHPLTIQDRGLRFSMITKFEVQRKQVYTVNMNSLPLTVQNEPPVSVSFRTSSCEVLNGVGSCICGPSPNILPAPTVKVHGYKVMVTTAIAHSCFNVDEYILQISKKPGRTAMRRQEISPTGRETHLNHTFAMLYNLESGYVYQAEVVLRFSGNAVRPIMMNATRFSVPAWKPSGPVLVEIKTGYVKISFTPASSDFGIEKYEVEILEENDDGTNPNKTFIKHATCKGVNQVCEEHMVKPLEPGLYLIKVREHRTAKGNVQATAWGSQSVITIVKPRYPPEPGLIAGIAFSVIAMVLVIAVIVCFYFWKTDRCQRIQTVLPRPIVEWLDSQTITHLKLRTRTLLIVWQSDVRSPELEGQHADNIRHLAAYLSRVCQLKVILDLFEELDLNQAMSRWVQRSCEEAEFVLFICPHYNRDAISTENEFLSLVGDFDRIYSYLSGQMRDRNKYITGRLPYSDIDSCDASKYLRNVTRVFSLMDHIEDLYFHVQGLAKMNVAGRRAAENINREDYDKTDEGRMLRDGITKFMSLQSEWNASAALTMTNEESLNQISVSSRDEDSDLNGSAETAEEPSLMIRRIENISPPEDPQEESKLMAHRLDGIAPPSDSNSSLYRTRPEVRPPPPLIENPEEAIRLINDRSQQETDFSSAICPYHGVPFGLHACEYYSSGDGGQTVPTPPAKSFGQFHSNQDDVCEKSADAAFVQLCVQSLPRCPALSTANHGNIMQLGTPGPSDNPPTSGDSGLGSTII